MSDQASTIMVNTLEPQSGTTLTVGKSGQNLVVNADSLKANVAKDAGGNAIFTSNGSGVLSGVNSGFGSAQVLISTTTVSSAVASIAFTSGIDSTYKEYVFEFINLNGVTDGVYLEASFSSDGGSSYGITKTTTAFRTRHDEANTTAVLGYSASDDIAQGTGSQNLSGTGVSNAADEASCGELHLFNPASTTYVKNFYNIQQTGANTWSYGMFVAGYLNTTSAVNAVKFDLYSGNINAGTIKMYGIK